ncbi:hypothetical protein [Piscinibacter sp.]|uniref:hypothetical protein n=1 Tax=Piscinibacter sp. TaxID=1903157 RepID=UPI002C0BD445|nr:hypothetical protein [Albitalea sp.]HUG26078.1 hypothetical protein [Albitalea sp.]
MKQPFRFWMTGSVAVVMAALGMGRSALASDRHPLSQSSRFRLTETVERIEACAAKHGLSVFARLGVDAEPQGERAEYTLIVFESSAGGTPVLMEGPRSQPEVPLTVCVRRDPSGLTEVLFAGSDWDDLPPTVARDLTELPMLVADALR